MPSIVPPQSASLESAGTERAVEDTGSKPEPTAAVSARVPRNFGGQLVALGQYMTRTEVHTYAFSVAANVILSLFPFIVLLLTISRRVFHSRQMESMVGDMMHSLLPVGQDFIMRNMQMLAHPRRGTQVFSLVMLLVTSSGVFLPLEIALNHVWGVTKNRSYIRNQAVSASLALLVGILTTASVAFTANQNSVMPWLFFGHTGNAAFALTDFFFLKIVSALASTLLFFLIYWILPNRPIPALAVLPTAVVTGLLWEGAKHLYVLALPWLDFQSVYGPFYISVGLMMWAFLSGLLLLAGAHFSATRHAMRLARRSDAASAEASAEAETTPSPASPAPDRVQDRSAVVSPDATAPAKETGS